MAFDSLDDKEKILDDYMAKLWSYDGKNPELGMRKAEELEKIFSKSDFEFEPLSYQAGELCYLSYYGGRLLYNMRLDKVMRERDRQKASKNGEKIERTEEDKQKDQLLVVTANRLAVIHRGLRDRIVKLDGLYYYKSTRTQAPFIDGRGRVFVFITEKAIANAKSTAAKNTDMELAFTNDIDELSKQFFLNGCDLIVVNDGNMPFEANRENILPESSSEEKSEEDRISENNRIMRYFILCFHQTLMSENVPENEDEKSVEEREDQKRKSLLQSEAQISTRLIMAKVHFAVRAIEGDQVEFVVVTDGQDRKALSCFVDKESVPVGGPFEYKEFPFLPIAAQVVQTQKEVEQKGITESDQVIDGIVINPGTLNFFVDINWLSRVIDFSQNMYEQSKKQKNEEKKQ